MSWGQTKMKWYESVWNLDMYWLIDGCVHIISHLNIYDTCCYLLDYTTSLPSSQFVGKVSDCSISYGHLMPLFNKRAIECKLPGIKGSPRRACHVHLCNNHILNDQIWNYMNIWLHIWICIDYYNFVKRWGHVLWNLNYGNDHNSLMYIYMNCKDG